MMNLRRLEMNNLPIRYKLIIHFLLISILPSLGMGLLVNWTVERIIERQANNHTLQLIEKVNQTMEFYINNMQNITYLIAFDPDVNAFLEGRAKEQGLDDNDYYGIRKYLQGFTTLHSEVAGILVVNKNGDYISNELYARSKKSLTEESWYKEAVERKGIFQIVGHPTKRNITSHVNYQDNEVISVVRAILDPGTQEVKGAVLIDLKLRVIAEAAKDVRLGKSGYLMVLNNQGERIYSPAHSQLEELPELWLETSHAGTVARKVNGDRLQFIYRTSPFTSWTTVGVFSTRESVPEYREIQFYVISFVFLVCMLGIAASYYLSYSISRPIHQLMMFMQRAEAGDLTIRRWGERTDEVGMLGRSFYRMLTQINKLLSLTELQEKQKREAELRTLQAHIKPHFLYNTLDTIHWMAHRKGADDVAHVVESLSSLFRIGLSRGEDVISLAEEVEHVQSYLTIQKTRYQDKLNYTLKVASGLEQWHVIKLVLQPLVENAIYHGIKERRGPGHIMIEAAQSGQDLLITVSDDGVGIPEAKLAELRNSLSQTFAGSDENKDMEAHGYGLLNVQERIQLTFGERYGLEIESIAGQGTKVTIRHPLINASLKNESGRHHIEELEGER